MEGGITHQPLLVSENQNDCPFVSCGISIFAEHRLVACVEQTDGQNYDKDELYHSVVDKAVDQQTKLN